MNSLSTPIFTPIVSKELNLEWVNQHVFNKITESPQHKLYTAFVKQVYDKMRNYEKVDFILFCCFNSLEKTAEELNIPKPCNNPLPDVCDCCRKC